MIMKMLIFSSFKIFYMRFFFPRFHLFLSLGKYFKAKSEYFISYLFIFKYSFIWLHWALFAAHVICVVPWGIFYDAVRSPL